MSVSVRILLTAGGLSLAAMAVAGHSVPSLQASMKAVIIPQAQVVWDITNGALDDAGNVDAARIAPADWPRLETAALKLKDSATTLAATDRVLVVAPGEKYEEGGGSATLNAEQVQALIDARPAAFDDELRAFADTSARLAAAAQARDGATLNVQMNQLNQACESCHQKYWYPQ